MKGQARKREFNEVRRRHWLRCLGSADRAREDAIIGGAKFNAWLIHRKIDNAKSGKIVMIMYDELRYHKKNDGFVNAKLTPVQTNHLSLSYIFTAFASYVSWISSSLPYSKVTSWYRIYHVSDIWLTDPPNRKMVGELPAQIYNCTVDITRLGWHKVK